MAPVDTDDTTDLPADRRAAGLELSDGGYLVYDPRNHHAWVESDRPHDLDRHR
ncbi:DUF7331 family protein [Halorarius litoreus]|uniref:DUF7331 family protein n=1 Tax=Halorarius litoreus TaxID=2962676 RepID=UPI0020CDFE2C|nr:hypothetical protein [Halorarius litoreus]